MSTLLITGASRGIGLEHVRQALREGESVIAACRSPSQALELTQLSMLHPGSLRIEGLDVTSADSISALAARLDGAPIDVLINNAGIYGPPTAPSWPEASELQSLNGMDYDLWIEILRINVLAPFQITAKLMPNLLQGQRKIVIMMSSELGSISLNAQGTSHAYRSSKAALNMLTRGLAVDLNDREITVVSLAPGWTKTDLGGAGADWSVQDSVRAQRRVLQTLDRSCSGQFINLTGEKLPW